MISKLVLLTISQTPFVVLSAIPLNVLDMFKMLQAMSSWLLLRYTPAVCCAASALLMLNRPKEANVCILKAKHAEPDNIEVCCCTFFILKFVRYQIMFETFLLEIYESMLPR
jgi:hypothetical protein